MFLKCSGEMGDRRITQQHRYIGDAETFLIEQITGMLHTLTLVEIKDRCTEHLFKAFFQITFVDGNFPAEFLDGEGFVDMLEKDFPGPDDLVAVCLIGEELTLETFNFLFAYHALQAV